ncbi:hypothetical protein MTO96_032901 [Rhipicephalus appendiculatus]
MKISSTLLLLATVTVFAVIIFGTVMAAAKEHRRVRRYGTCISVQECEASCKNKGGHGFCVNLGDRNFCMCPYE